MNARRAAQAAARPATVQRGASARPTANDFSGDAMLRRRKPAPRRGWRRFLYGLTGGRINLGPSPSETQERQLIARVRTPLVGCRRIAVISRKGGVGKTTSTVMLGHTFAAWRGDRVVALDGNPDAGSLGYRIRRETAATVSDMLAARDKITRYADIRAYTSQAPTRLEVVASDDDPRIATAIGEEEYRQAIEMLENHYNLILLDTGTGIMDSATRGILDVADQIVVVMGPSLDSARASSLTLDWLDEHRYGHLVRGAVAVINAVPEKEDGLVELQRIEAHFDYRCREVVRIPWDSHLDAGAETALDEVATGTRMAYLRLAAAVADGFSFANLR